MREGAPFDLVYIWGVLHHTGRLWAAMDRAADMVAPGGTLAVALYRKTPLCGFWRAEKAFYSRLPGWARPVLTAPYAAGLLAAQLFMGRNPLKYIRNYQSQRGMDVRHDVIDWLGGYPYESASPAEVAAWAARRGLTPVRADHTPPPRGRGILGTRCAEYVFTRSPL